MKHLGRRISNIAFAAFAAFALLTALKLGALALGWDGTEAYNGPRAVAVIDQPPAE